MSVLNSDSSYQSLLGTGQLSLPRELLQTLLKQEEIRDIDCHFAEFILGLCRWPETLSAAQQTDHTLICLLAVKLSAELAAGHVCVPLTVVNDWFIEHALNPPEQWHERLFVYPPFARGEGIAPIVFEYESFYFERFWRFEKSIADYALQSMQGAETATAANATTIATNSTTIMPAGVQAGLTRLFGPLSKDSIDWQRLAACLALKQKFLLVSGGPGTGKTTTVIKLLALLLEQLFANPDTNSPVIKMAAPTGKAAARLSESIRAAKNSLEASSTVKTMIPEEAQTLHRLLGYQANATEFRHNANNPLLIDVLVVDEASMIDVAMMAKLLQSLPSFTRVILLGDKDQLSSVEAGSVFADLNLLTASSTPSQAIKQQFDLPFDVAETGRSENRSVLGAGDSDGNIPWYYSRQLSEWLIDHGAVARTLIDPATLAEQSDADCRANLHKSYRFSEASCIKRLAVASNAGDAATFLQLLRQGGEDFLWYANEVSEGSPSTCPQALVDEAVAAYRNYLQLLAQIPSSQQAAENRATAVQIIKCFEDYRILCAANHGPQGVEGINQQIESALAAGGLINIDSQFYVGRPIMIETNNYDLKLYNGDVGLCLADSQGVRYVAFLGADGEIRRFLPGRIPQHRTVFAMTVHKSQGSEFNHAALVLPQSYTPLLSRELLYTAITRAKQRFSLYGSEILLKRMIAAHTQRWSGLSRRLQSGRA